MNHFPAIDHIRRIKELRDLREELGDLSEVTEAIDLMLESECATLRKLIEFAKEAS